MLSDGEDIKNFSIKLKDLEKFYRKLFDTKNSISIEEYYNDHLSKFLLDITEDAKNKKKFGEINIEFLSNRLNRLATSFNELANQDIPAEKNTTQNNIRTIFSEINQGLKQCLEYFIENNPNIDVYKFEPSTYNIPPIPQDQLTSEESRIDKKAIYLDSIEQENKILKDIEDTKIAEIRKKKSDANQRPQIKSPAQKKVAIVIGIDAYESESKIPKLKGAENDAESIYRILKNNCGFEINGEHFLKGKEATYRRVIKAISTILRGNKEYDLMLFYFSGHGFIDNFGKGYFATYDIDSDDPLVCGIEMEKLSKMIHEKEKADYVIILDCCYSGKIFENTRSLGTNQGFEKLRNNIKMIQMEEVSSSNTLSDLSESSLSGRRIILASTDEKSEAHEKKFLNSDTQTEEYHGIFSYYLIEALKGRFYEKGNNSIPGIIRLKDIIEYIKRNLSNKENRTSLIVPTFPEDENIILALTKDFNIEIDKKIEAISRELIKNTLNSIYTATQNIIELEGQLDLVKIYNEQIESLKNKIDEKWKEYKKIFEEKIKDENFIIKFRKDIDEIEEGLSFNFYNLSKNLNYEYIKRNLKSFKWDIENLKILYYYINSDISEEDKYNTLIEELKNNIDQKNKSRSNYQ